MISNEGGRNQNASKYASLYTFNGSPLCLYFPVERRALKEDDEFFHKQTKKLEKVRVNLEDFVEPRSLAKNFIPGCAWAVLFSAAFRTGPQSVSRALCSSSSSVYELFNGISNRKLMSYAIPLPWFST